MKKYSSDWWLGLKPERLGKETELLVESVLVEANKDALFAWHRLPDARAARGAMQAQPADILWRRGQRSGFVEIKALKHETRLPAARLTQLPTLRKWAWAGALNYVLVFHTTKQTWRCINILDLPSGATSYDLSGWPEFASAELALRACEIIK